MRRDKPLHDRLEPIGLYPQGRHLDARLRHRIRTARPDRVGPLRRGPAVQSDRQDSGAGDRGRRGDCRECGNPGLPGLPGRSGAGASAAAVCAARPGPAAAKQMVEHGKGTIMFTGATSATRGGAEFTAFAAAKAGLRSIAQSMARSLGPRGIHVCHVVVDGAIDMPAIHERFPDLAASPSRWRHARTGRHCGYLLRTPIARTVPPGRSRSTSDPGARNSDESPDCRFAKLRR